MKRRIQIFLLVLVLMTAALSCNLPTRGQDVSTTQSAANGASAPTPTPPIDFSTVGLELADLPQGFTQISEAETVFGVDLRTFLHNITSPLAKAEPENVTIFQDINPQNTTIVVSFIVQPLTLLERGAFDILAKNPQRVIDLFKGSTSGLTFSAQTELEKIGAAVVSVSFSYDQTNIPIDGNLVISRRDQVVQVALEAHPRASAAAISALDVARIMNGKIQAVLK